MDSVAFKKPLAPRQRVIIKVLPWKVPAGYGDVVPEDVKQWVEAVEPSMSLNRLCARIKHTFENDLHQGKGSGFPPSPCFTIPLRLKSPPDG